MGNKLHDLSGKRFGRLVVLSFAGTVGKFSTWLCRCDCGRLRTVYAANLVSGATAGCGRTCRLQPRVMHIAKRKPPYHVTHSMTHTPFYRIWRSVAQRCRNQGVRTEWQCFADFKRDMHASYLRREEKGEILTLKLTDSRLGYSRRNCRWVSL